MALLFQQENDILEKNKGVVFTARSFMDSKKEIKLPKVFDQNPDLKKKVQEYLSTVPQEQKEKDYETLKKFIAGEITWAEIKGIPQALLKEAAKHAYLCFQQGDLKHAESIFLALSVTDHNNWYYQAALGAIYQKQKLFDRAIDAYTLAIELNEQEVTCYTNRGECYLRLQNYKHAFEDFEKTISLDKELHTPWGRRAKILRDKLIKEGHGETLES